MRIAFEAIEELVPGPRWAALFARHWPRYGAWFLQEGEAARTSYAASLRALQEHMPELLPTYERLYAHRAYLGKDVVDPVRARARELARRHDVRDRRSIRLEPDVPIPPGAAVPAPGQLSLLLLPKAG